MTNKSLSKRVSVLVYRNNFGAMFLITASTSKVHKSSVKVPVCQQRLGDEKTKPTADNSSLRH